MTADHPKIFTVTLPETACIFALKTSVRRD
jgi:hypothetical protein